MTRCGCHSTRYDPSLWPVGVGAVLALLLVTLLGCAGQPATPGIASLAPLHLPERTLLPDAAAAKIPEIDLLAVDAAMQEFVQRYTGDVHKDRSKMLSLHQAVRSASMLDIQYDPFAEGSAIDTYHRGTANCLSYASLFVALAREAGLKANYHWQEVRPQWNRTSDQVQVGLHVNVLIQTRDGAEFIVDIDPIPTREVTDSAELSDAEAHALFYNNLAMVAFADRDFETTWNYLMRALQTAPDMSHLWVNLGALYRANGQHRDAEGSYLYALTLDSLEHSAMINLAILYGLEGREEDRAFWLDKVDYHRQTNPYYHAWRGDEAATQGDFALALEHYDEAVRLMPNDGTLLYARGLVYYRLNDIDGALNNIQQAKSLATRRKDITFYKVELARIREAKTVGS